MLIPSKLNGTYTSNCERVTPGAVFEKVGVDKLNMAWYVQKAYICIFLSLAVKAVHIEAVSDLTSEVFITTLQPSVDCRGCPSLIWSDNFARANRRYRNFLASRKPRKHSLTFAPLLGLNGVSSQNNVHILADYGSQL
jgi:hypothetical protein